MGRKLASIQTIKELKPIEGADRIEIAVVEGWNVVVRKNEFNVGDKIIYFEIDSMLPMDNQNFRFLVDDNYDKARYHLRTIKLRGQVSQGLILPTSILDKEFNVGDDLTEYLNIEKYEEPIKITSTGDKLSAFPCFITKTDEIRIQNMPELFETLDKDEWYATEKIDGTSCTVYATPDHTGVLTRNNEISEGRNLYWEIAANKKLNTGDTIKDFLTKYAKSTGETIAVQGELFGEGINKNTTKIKGHDYLIFNVIINGKRLTIEEVITKFMTVFWPTTWVPVHENKIPDTLEDLIKSADDVHSKVEGSDCKQIEGFVWRNKNTTTLENNSETSFASFKTVSNKYLLKKGE